MKRVNRNPYDVAEKLSNLVSRRDFSGGSDKKCGLNLKQSMGFFLLCLMLFSALLSVSMVLQEPPSDDVAEASTSDIFQPKQSEGLNQDFSHSVELQRNEPLGGLLAVGFDKRSCLISYMSGTYGKGLSGKLSSYLISRLRKHEALHKEC